MHAHSFTFTVHYRHLKCKFVLFLTGFEAYKTKNSANQCTYKKYTHYRSKELGDLF